MSVNVTELFGSNVFSHLRHAGASAQEDLCRGHGRHGNGGNISIATADIVANA